MNIQSNQKNMVLPVYIFIKPVFRLELHKLTG